MSLVRILVGLLSGLVLGVPQLFYGLTIADPFHFRDHTGSDTVLIPIPADALFFGALSVVPSGVGTSVLATQGPATVSLNHLGYRNG